MGKGGIPFSQSYTHFCKNSYGIMANESVENRGRKRRKSLDLLEEFTVPSLLSSNKPQEPS